MNPKIRKIVMSATSLLMGDVDAKIVFYHDLFKEKKYYEHATPLDLFKRHFSVAKKLGFEHVSRIPVEKKSYHICFDDGFRGILDCREDLDSMGIKPTVYVAVDLIGKPGFLSKSEILSLQKEGYDFQSHTWSHEYLPMYDDDGLKRELADSRKWLSDFLQKDVDQICFPRGLFTEKVYEESLNAGYKYLISSIPGSVRQGVMPNVLPRNLVQEYSEDEYGLVLKGAMSVFRGYYFKRHYSA